jgi:hypothetical protein
VKAASLNSGPGQACAVAAVCGLIVLISLFLPWAQVVRVFEAESPYPTGWQVLRVLDVPIALLAVSSVGVAALAVVRAAPLPALGLAVVGLVTVILVLLAPLVEDRPMLDFGGSWFLGLLAAFGVLGAGLFAFVLLRPSKDDGEGEEEEEG